MYSSVSLLTRFASLCRNASSCQQIPPKKNHVDLFDTQLFVQHRVDLGQQLFVLLHRVAKGKDNFLVGLVS